MPKKYIVWIYHYIVCTSINNIKTAAKIKAHTGGVFDQTECWAISAQWDISAFQFILVPSSTFDFYRHHPPPLETPNVLDLSNPSSQKQPSIIMSPMILGLGWAPADQRHVYPRSQCSPRISHLERLNHELPRNNRLGLSILTCTHSGTVGRKGKCSTK